MYVRAHDHRLGRGDPFGWLAHGWPSLQNRYGLHTVLRPAPFRSVSLHALTGQSSEGSNRGTGDIIYQAEELG